MLVHSYSVCLYFAIVVGCFFFVVVVFLRERKDFRLYKNLYLHILSVFIRVTVYFFPTNSTPKSKHFKGYVYVCVCLCVSVMFLYVY